MRQWWRLPQEKNSSCIRAPPCEELDPPTYDIKLVLCRKLPLFLRKSTQIVATRAALFDSNMHQSFIDWGFASDPLGELTALIQTPPAVITRLTSKGREGEVRAGERRGGEGEDEVREFVVCRTKKKRTVVAYAIGV